MWNKLLDIIKMYFLIDRNWWGKQEEKPEPISIEEQIKNSKDYQNRYGG